MDIEKAGTQCSFQGELGVGVLHKAPDDKDLMALALD